jgi:hypothetical protein
MGGLPAMHVNTTLLILISAFVCRRTFVQGIISTHKETGARTCSPLCFTLYERWWLRKRPHVHPVVSAPSDVEVR